MASTWQIFKEIAKKKLTWEDQTVKVRIDKDLPLGLRIGSMLQISSPELILAADKLKIKAPIGDLTVIAYGTFLISPFKSHRFYVTDTKESLYTLQVVINQEERVVGAIDEIRLFSLFDEIFTDDWIFWLGEEEGYIGLSVCDLKPEDGGTRYFRVWSNSLEEIIISENADDKITHIPPIKFRETFYSNPFGEKTEIMEHEAMLYGRNVAEEVDEYLLLSAAEKPSETASIQIMVGIPVEPASIKVLF